MCLLLPAMENASANWRFYGWGKKAQRNQESGPRSQSSQVKINYGFDPGVTYKASGSSIVSLNRVSWEQRHRKILVLGSFT